MKRTVPINDVVAWPFLLPGNLACDALGLARHRDLVLMFLSSVGLASGRYKGNPDVIHLLHARRITQECLSAG